MLSKMENGIILTKNKQVSTCQFCTPNSQEIKIILKGALLRLKKLSKNLKLKISQSEPPSNNSSTQIHRLLKIMFERHQFELKVSQFCSHLPLHNLLRSKLGCKVNELQHLIQVLCQQIARRSYELEVVSIQIKHVEQSVTQLKCNIKVSEPICQTIHQTPQVVEEIQQVKVEDQPKPFQYVSPHTGTSFQSSFDNVSYQFNLMYYGHLMYQTGEN